MGASFSYLSRIRWMLSPPPVPKLDKPDAPLLRIGLLGAADIALSAVVAPARNHPEVIISAVAARSEKKARKYAKSHGIDVVYFGPEGYQDLIDDPRIDIVYNALPNALHLEWSMKALKAGKHVLLEKPATCTAKEARELFAYAEEKGLVLLEARHTRFHPAVVRFKEIVDSGELGKIVSCTTSFMIPSVLSDDNIRFDLKLGGGMFLDMGSYVCALTRYAFSSEPLGVMEAHPIKYFPSASDDSDAGKVDMSTSATLLFPNNVKAHLSAGFYKGSSFGKLWDIIGFIYYGFGDLLQCELENGSIEFKGCVAPHLGHSLIITRKDGEKRVEKVYAYKDAPEIQKNWSTYRYQLDALVDKVRGREPRNWVTAEDSIKNMECLDMVYEKSGLGLRPSASFSFEK